MIDFTKPIKITVCGFNQSGKTTFVKDLINKYQNPVIVYDWHGEYADCGANVFWYKPKFMGKMEERRAELNEFVQRCFIDKKSKVQLLVVDEGNEYCPNFRPLPRTILDLYNNHAHYNQSMITIARRPSDLNSKLMELAHYRVFFKLFGKNDMKYLDELRTGLSDVVVNLEPFHYVILDSFGNMEVYSPVGSEQDADLSMSEMQNDNADKQIEIETQEETAQD